MMDMGRFVWGSFLYIFWGRRNLLRPMDGRDNDLQWMELQPTLILEWNAENWSALTPCAKVFYL